MTDQRVAASGRHGPGPDTVAPRARGVTSAKALGAAALLALLLASCLQPPPPPPPAERLESRDRFTPADAVDLAPGEWVDYELVMDGVRPFDLAYVELVTTQPAVVELRDGTYWRVLASSDRPDYFVRGALAGVPQPVPGAASALEPTTITENVVCGGPCVIFEPGGGRFYLRVVNTGSTGLTADLFFYGASFADSHEPDNDHRSTAPVLADGESGALEVLGDVDYWLATAEANVTVQPVAGGIAVQATVYDGCGLAVAGPNPGDQTFRVFAGEAVRIRAAQDRAAPSGRSGYFLRVDPPSGPAPPRGPGCTAAVANTSPNVPVVTQAMGGGSTAVISVSVPSSVRSRDVIQFEVDGQARLEVMGPGGSTLYSSASPDVFYAGGAASVAAPELAPAGVAVSRTCSGPCVIVEGPGSSYLLRVRNLGSARTVRVYAFGRSFDDTTEPANDSLATAPSVSADGQGAIETVGDVDLWYVPATGTIRFETVAGGPPLVLDVLGPSGIPLTGGLQPGSIAVQAGEYVRVRAADPNAAAVAGRSRYFLFY